MIYEISNQFLHLKINSKGAELNSIKDKDGRQRLWQANSSIWGRHAPVLFPIVGKLKNNEYSLDGNKYEMGQHGFARDMEFHEVEKAKDSLIMELDASQSTRHFYPENFSLQVKYQLDEQTIKVNLLVKNNDKDTMWYSIGAHPGFKIPINDGESYSDYQISVSPATVFNKINLISSYSDSHHPNKIDFTKPFQLDHKLFTHDANILVLNKQPTRVTINDPKTHSGVGLEVDKAPYLGIWSSYPQKGNFVCIEPWWGLADDVDSDGQYKDKVAIQTLPSKQSASHKFTIKIF